MANIDEFTDDNNLISGLWSERVLIVTKDYEIQGFIFMPKIGKQNRIISDILNSSKRFVAVKDCQVTYRNQPNRRSEFHDFVQINIFSIILLRPIKEDEINVNK